MEEDLRINLFSFVDLRNEPSYDVIFHLFDQSYYRYSRCPGQNEHLTFPTGNIPSFVVNDNIISPIALYEKFPYKSVWGLLVCVQFLIALNIYLAGDLK